MVTLRQLYSFPGQAAMAAYLKDVENNTRDITAERIIKEKWDRIETKEVRECTLQNNLLNIIFKYNIYFQIGSIMYHPTVHILNIMNDFFVFSRK